jgi:hypothetical protein
MKAIMKLIVISFHDEGEVFNLIERGVMHSQHECF